MAATEEIKTDLDQILNQIAKEHNIDNYEITSNVEADYGDGMLGKFYKGNIRNKSTGKIMRVVVKRAPFLGEFDVKAFYLNEIMFYSKSFPVLDVLQKEAKVSKPFDNIPKYLRGELEPKKEYLSMEDLKPSGYVMFDKTKYLDEEHLEAIFKTYGRFHALSFVLKNQNFERFKTVTKDFIDLSQLIGQIAAKQMVTALSAAVNALDTEEDKVVFEELKNFGQKSVELFLSVCVYKGQHSCLIHGDCWSNNMLFKYSDSGKLLDIKLIDFQLCQENTPIHDLSYFFYSGASKKDFDKLEDYLKMYHQSFSEFAKELGGNPDELLPFEGLKQEWKEYSLFGVLMGVYLWQLKLIPKTTISQVVVEGAAQMEQQKNMSMEDAFKAWENILTELHSSDVYKQRTTAILRHAFEYDIVDKNKINGTKDQGPL